MKKLIFAFLLLTFTATAFTSCREKTTGEKIEDAVDDVGDEIEDAVD
ncbi:hypothetical protein KXJ69_11780 [Aureisphaera sp. CAU 1614]|uniref:Entericidin EcnA/B family protein n=1 Tax=Halomarinibacterium sedimenti TaxID=2857106 RepID=A0A9X1JY27_9FLAO|nr:hypothetical protein [Halomarinibacterium sedimenti]MBW2938793.1 hypothetical protein [Halomarinibacterium sedimenti]|tara:strand:+ start:888 stop:1028 length:141 start_codon:yes stop_codon:yes gene_type:complete